MASVIVIVQKVPMISFSPQHLRYFSFGLSVSAPPLMPSSNFLLLFAKYPELPSALRICVFLLTFQPLLHDLDIQEAGVSHKRPSET